MCSFSTLLWYVNHGDLVFYRFSKDAEWLEWHPENGMDVKAMYKIIDANTWETKACV